MFSKETVVFEKNYFLTFLQKFVILLKKHNYDSLFLGDTVLPFAFISNSPK
jgi:hypothetical protein